jgi:hypothetical protein
VLKSIPKSDVLVKRVVVRRNIALAKKAATAAKKRSVAHSPVQRLLLGRFFFFRTYWAGKTTH